MILVRCVDGQLYNNPICFEETWFVTFAINEVNLITTISNKKTLTDALTKAGFSFGGLLHKHEMLHHYPPSFIQSWQSDVYRLFLTGPIPVPDLSKGISSSKGKGDIVYDWPLNINIQDTVIKRLAADLILGHRQFKFDDNSSGMLGIMAHFRVGGWTVEWHDSTLTFER